SLATVTPSCVTVGAPHFLSRATLRPRGPSVALTAPARVSIPRLSERRASSLKRSCFAAISPVPPCSWFVSGYPHVWLALPHDGSPVEGELSPGVLRERDRKGRRPARSSPGSR